eukprot:gene8434-260_t
MRNFKMDLKVSKKQKQNIQYEKEVLLLNSNEASTSKRVSLVILIVATILVSTLIIIGMVGLTLLVAFLRPSPGLEELKLMIDGDDTLNYFYGNDKMNVHAVVSKNSTTPRLIYALPAGNEGFLVFFESSIFTQYIFQQDTFRPIENGMENDIEITQDLKITKILMGSSRVLRHFMQSGEILFPEMKNEITFEDKTQLTYSRTQLNGKDKMSLSFSSAYNVEIIKKEDGFYLKIMDSKQTGKLKIQIKTTKVPLTRISRDKLFINKNDDIKELEFGLSFLSYEEKLLAGSWRFNTYFGRDTLMSLEMLMPILRSSVIESSLESVLHKLDKNGDVAHEEAIDDFSDFIHKVNNRSDLYGQPIFDYKMIDDDFMLLPVLKNYLLNFGVKEKAMEFFKRNKELILRNMNFVIEKSKNFYQNSTIDNLIHIREGITVGNWRDSAPGLGYATVPYDVNVALVPAALNSITTIINHGYLSKEEVGEIYEKSKKYFKVWSEKSSIFFNISISNSIAKSRIIKYCNELKIDSTVYLNELEDKDINFNSLSIHNNGSKIHVMHTDTSYLLVFTEPSEEELKKILTNLIGTFPVGLLIPKIGVSISNPCFSDSDFTKSNFKNGHYHGTTIWSWHQAFLILGIQKQSKRELTAETKKLLKITEKKLWEVINETEKIRQHELWSFIIDNGKFKYIPFSEVSDKKRESNALQLWSTVYLSIKQ